LNKIKKKKRKKRKEKNKGKRGLAKIFIHDSYSSPSTKAPTYNIMHLYLSLHPYVWTSLAKSPHLHGLDETFMETSPFLWVLAQ
jgi:hypothetical protein